MAEVHGAPEAGQLPRAWTIGRRETETNQQPSQRHGVVPDPVWVGSKWLLTFQSVPVTPGTPHHHRVASSDKLVKLPTEHVLRGDFLGAHKWRSALLVMELPVCSLRS